jgi:hypothetical protein
MNVSHILQRFCPLAYKFIGYFDCFMSNAYSLTTHITTLTTKHQHNLKEYNNPIEHREQDVFAIVEGIIKSVGFFIMSGE